MTSITVNTVQNFVPCPLKVTEHAAIYVSENTSLSIKQKTCELSLCVAVVRKDQYVPCSYHYTNSLPQIFLLPCRNAGSFDGEIKFKTGNRI